MTKKRVYKKICQFCGKVFLHPTAGKKYCSDKCKDMAYSANFIKKERDKELSGPLFGKAKCFHIRRKIPDTMTADDIKAIHLAMKGRNAHDVY